MGLPSGARNPPCVLKIRNCFRPDLGGIPAHAGVLRQAEQIAAGLLQQHFFGERQTARRARTLWFGPEDFRCEDSNGSTLIAGTHAHH